MGSGSSRDPAPAAEPRALIWAEQVAALAPAEDARPGGMGAGPQAVAMRTWIGNVVVGHKLCPFAAVALGSGALALVSLQEAEEVEVAAKIVTHAQVLAECGAHMPGGATTIAIAPHCKTLRVFEDYLGVCELIDEALDRAGLSGVVQLFRFHPDFRFADSASKMGEEDPADFVMRTPIPAFHLQLEAELGAALHRYAQTCVEMGEAQEWDPEAAGQAISERNAAFLRARGLSACVADLKACKDLLRLTEP